MEDLIVLVAAKDVKNKKRIRGEKLGAFNLYNAEILLFGVPVPCVVVRKPLLYLIVMYAIMLIPFSIMCIFSPKNNNLVEITEMCFSYSLIEGNEPVIKESEDEKNFWKGFGEE